MAAERIRAGRLDEARAEMKKGEEALKTGIFKWNKDYDTAARAFEAAGNRFQNSAMLEEGKSAFCRAAECKMKGKTPNYFFAAKLYENACVCCEKQMEEAAEASRRAELAREAASYMLLANDYYQMNGNFERSVESIQKAAKVCAQEDPERALKNYMMLHQVLAQLDKAGMVIAIDAVREAVQFAVMHTSFREAIALYADYLKLLKPLEQHNEANKVSLSTIIVHLANGDGGGAGKALHELLNEVEAFQSSEEYIVATNILAAYADRDAEALKAAKKNGCVMKLDNVLIKCTAALKVDGACVDPAFGNPAAGMCGVDMDQGPVDLGADANPAEAVPAVVPDDLGTDLC